VRSEGPGRIVALEGPSAVGKTTISRLLASRSDWVVLGEASVRLRPRPSLRFVDPTELVRLERRLLVEERRRCRAAERLRRDGIDVLLDTAPVGPATYSLGLAKLDPAYNGAAAEIAELVIEDLRTGRLAAPQQVLYISASDRTLRRRAASSRADHPEGLAARHRAVGRFERAFWSSVARGSGGSVLLVPTRGPASADAARLLREISRPTLGRRPGFLESRLRKALRVAVEGGTEIVKNRARSRRPPRR
jgi:hypothetical protein